MLIMRRPVAWKPHHVHTQDTPLPLIHLIPSRSLHGHGDHFVPRPVLRFAPYERHAARDVSHSAVERSLVAIKLTLIGEHVGEIEGGTHALSNAPVGRELDTKKDIIRC